METMGPEAPFKPSLIMGINDAALDSGVYRPWPNEKVGFEVCAQIASRLKGPEILPEAGLSKRSALAILNELKTASDRCYEAGYRPDVAALYQIKQAAALDLDVRAARVAEAYMAKAAADNGSLTNVDQNTPESAAHDDQVAKLDLHNRGAAEYLVGVGNTHLPAGGVVGKEMAHPKRQTTSASVSNSLTEHSAKAASAKTARNIEAELASLALGLGKKADEDMALGDLGGQAPGIAQDPNAGAMGAAPMPSASPEAPGRLKMMLQALMSKFHRAPSPEGQLATAGLAEHPEGMNVMASVLEHAKTAEDADAILQEILQHQGQAGQLASPELIQAIQELLAQEGGGEGAEAAQAPPAGMSPVAAPPEDQKMAALMADLKKIAEGGSLTSVGKNTPESAAKDDQFAELDQKNRSTNQYLEGQGGTAFPNKGQQYAIQKNKAHDHPVATNNVPSRETKSASSKNNGATKAAEADKLSPEDEDYVAQLRKVAEAWGPKLPALMTSSEKVAHIRQLHARAPRERAAYVANLTG